MTRVTIDDTAAATTTSFIVAVAVFVLAFSVVTVFVKTQVAADVESTGESVDLGGHAQGALRAITSTAGLPPDWDDAAPPQSPTRLGLLRVGSESVLDLEKVQALNRDLNTQDWYWKKARNLFGLRPYHFHLASHPLLKADSNGEIDGVDAYRVAYVGRHTSASPPATSIDPFVPDGAGETDAGLLDDVGVDFEPRVADGDGFGDARGFFGAGDTFPDDRPEYLQLLALRLANVTFSTGGTTSDYWKVLTLRELDAVQGPSPYLSGADRPQDVLTIANPTWASGSEDYGVATSGVGDADVERAIIGPIDLTAYGADDSAVLRIEHRVRGHVSSGASQDKAMIAYCDLADVTCTTLDSWTNLAGPWSERPSSGAVTFWATDDVSLSALLGKEFYLALAWDPGNSNDVARKGWFVKTLTVTATDGAGPSRTLHANAFDATASRYDALVVGSGAEHDALDDGATAGVFRYMLKQWVRAGGDLLVLGTDDPETDWLAPHFATSGATAAPEDEVAEAASDHAHPILHTPHDLAYAAYRPRGEAIEPSSAVFTHVLYADEVGASVEDVPTLSVANANPYYNGTVVITAYSPAPADAMPDADEKKFIVNLLGFLRFGDLYVDWGEPIPGRVSVGSASRTMLVDATREGLGTPEVQLSMYVWK